MNYNYENLDEHGFQKFAQALILVEHPRAQCLPVRQPDGGRDAILLDSPSNKGGFVVFQVKFSLDPRSKSEREVIESLIKSDKDKVNRLVQHGATHYYLITNVAGTAHLTSGSIDRANATLAASLNIPSQVWWRDDLDGRVDKALDVKWSYPQIISATDLLPLLLDVHGDNARLRSTRIIKDHVATQYASDREIKFKQVDLKHTLADVFVDIPLSEKGRGSEPVRDRRPPRPNVPERLNVYLQQLDKSDEYESEELHPTEHSGLAAAFFLQMPILNGVSRFVIEGAPDQGKSTVTQFVCQVNRIRLLGYQYELEKVDARHKVGPVRTPFRLDLRDYAAWLTGRHPFAPGATGVVPTEGRRSLESFIAMQVAWQSGPADLTQDQLLDFLAATHSVIVLDGLDEVADIETRTSLVDEVCKAAARLENHTRSLQLVVTSRPAAFANSPGFPDHDWIHVKLDDLYRVNVDAYADKWCSAQGLNPGERTMLEATLTAKLEQPHFRDLARNPMQLAILLHLIHVQGAALPEKRTALYGKYMELFFDREAAKADIVRDRRDLLLAIHGVLAWVLHTQAEDGAGGGSITRIRLAGDSPINTG